MRYSVDVSNGRASVLDTRRGNRRLFPIAAARGMERDECGVEMAKYIAGALNLADQIGGVMDLENGEDEIRNRKGVDPHA